MSWATSFCIVGSLWGLWALLFHISELKRWNIPAIARVVNELEDRVTKLEKNERKVTDIEKFTDHELTAELKRRGSTLCG